MIDYDKINDTAEKIYQSIMDGEARADVQTAIDKYQDKHGDILVASEADDLIMAVIKYTVEMSKDYDY